MAKGNYAKTYEEIYAHAKALTARLEEDTDYQALLARARTLGITVSVTPRHTFSPEYVPHFIPDADATGKLPAGYAMELWIDLNCGDHILAFTDDEGNDVQCSYTMLAACEENFLLFSRVALYSYEKMMADNQLIAILTDCLDAAEDGVSGDSPFRSDLLTPTEPRGERGLIVGRDAVGEGSYVEIVRGDYDGTFGHEDAYYFSEDGFLPYRMLLLALFGAERISIGSSLTLTAEEAAQFADALDELPEALSTVFSYSDALAETYGLEAFLPPPRLETCLNRLTLHRDEAFLDDAARLAAHIAPEDGETTSVTFIW